MPRRDDDSFENDYEDFDDFSDEDVLEDEVTDESDDLDEDDELDDDASDEEVEEVAQAEPPPPPPPDDAKAVTALKKLRVRLDVNEQGNVWRVIFDDMNGRDDALVLLQGLPALKELWIIGTRVTPKAAESIKEDRPELTVYY